MADLNGRLKTIIEEWESEIFALDSDNHFELVDELERICNEMEVICQRLNLALLEDVKEVNDNEGNNPTCP